MPSVRLDMSADYKIKPDPPSIYFLCINHDDKRVNEIFEWASWGKSGSNFIRSVDGSMFNIDDVLFIFND